eukprot:GILJ01004065.1.p1 GENE.GILJ01004065.1~~GILJ01004065.1.p1  ORF type:complete len:326 (-),score=42.45 GILJ01004065.1:312-1289(-)
MTTEPTQLRTFYPEIEPYNSGWFTTNDGIHKIYYEESGNPSGKPVIFLHGGPGGGTDPKCRRFFDASVYRIVLMDQRGSGKSQPYASLEENTTWKLVEDIEQLRSLLHIDKWMVFGGSWGSTLSLAYAITHPSRVTELVLRGIFLIRKHELQFFYQAGSSYIFPDAFEDYVSVIPMEERDDLIGAFYKRLTSEDSEERLRAARAWSIWEGRTSKLIEDPNFVKRFAGDEFSLAFARIECHYFVHNAWFPTDNYLIENVDKIRHIPTVIVQGRYDVVCPTLGAWELKRAWPEAQLTIVPDTGHSAYEPKNLHHLIEATDKFRPPGV